MKKRNLGILLFVVLMVFTASLLTGCGGDDAKKTDPTPAPTAAATATPVPEKSSKLEGSWVCDGVGRLDFGNDGNLVAYNATDSTKENIKYTLEYPADNPKAINIKLGSGETETAVFSDENTFAINGLTYKRAKDSGTSLNTKELIIGKWTNGEGSTMEVKANGEIVFVEDGKESKAKYTLVEDPGTPDGIGIKLSDRDAELFVFTDADSIVCGDLKMTRMK